MFIKIILKYKESPRRNKEVAKSWENSETLWLRMHGYSSVDSNELNQVTGPGAFLEVLVTLLARDLILKSRSMKEQSSWSELKYQCILFRSWYFHGIS